MSFAAIRNSVNFQNSHQRQVDEVTLCEPKSDLDLGSQSSGSRSNFSNRSWFSCCTVKNIQCFFLGMILFLFLLLLGHVWSLPFNLVSVNRVFVNLTSELMKESKLIRQSLTKNDYKDPQAVCPSNLYTLVGPDGFWSSCYLIGGSGQLEWEEARKFCQEKGGDLMSIESEIESKFITKEVKKMSPVFSYWIGGTDGGNEGKWFWAPTNQRINYSDWSYNAPDNKDGIENCLSFSNQRWNDISCSIKQGVICESILPSAKDYVKPHVFEKPSTVCPLPSDFTTTTTTTTTKFVTPRTTTKTTTKTTMTPKLSHENSTAKSCYLFMEAKMSWQTAQDFCEENGGYLAAINSERENFFILRNLKGLTSKDTIWWLGGNDFERSENDWIWTGPKTPMHKGYSDWMEHEPNNGFAVPENCLAMQKRTYSANHWMDTQCGVWRPSVCEVPNPYYNGSEALEFSHDIEDYVSESLCLNEKSNSSCSNGTWTCYTFARVQMNWSTAQQFCRSRGGTLACPDTREKTDMVFRKAKTYSSNGYYWLGATDEEKDGSWFWTRNSSSPDPAPVFDSNIATSLVTRPPREGWLTNCLRMEVRSYRYRMYWRDTKCNNWSWVVCETTGCDKTR